MITLRSVYILIYIPYTTVGIRVIVVSRATGVCLRDNDLRQGLARETRPIHVWLGRRNHQAAIHACSGYERVISVSLLTVATAYYSIEALDRAI